MHGQKTTEKKSTTTLEVYLGESPVPLIELYFAYTEKTISQIKIAASFLNGKTLACTLHAKHSNCKSTGKNQHAHPIRMFTPKTGD